MNGTALSHPTDGASMNILMVTTMIPASTAANRMKGNDDGLTVEATLYTA